MSLSEELIATVKQMIGDSKEITIRPATVATVEPPEVLFDGSQGAVDCLNVTDVPLSEGRRVVVAKVGSDQVIIGRFGEPDPTTPLPTEYEISEGAGTSTYSNSSFATATTTDAAEGTFVAPPSGAVIVHITINKMNMSAASVEGKLSFRLGTGAVIGAGTEILAASTVRCLTHAGVDSQNGHLSKYISGLTAGETYNIELQGRCPTNTLNVLGSRIIIDPK